MNITVDRVAAARYGIGVGEVQQVIESAVGETVLTTTIEGRARFPVRVRYRPEDRADPEALAQVLVSAPGGAQIPLGQLAHIDHAPGPAMISSENGLLLATVLLNVQGRDVGGFVQEARDTVARAVTLPSNCYIGWSGRWENQERARQRLQIVVPIVLVIIFILLYFMYGSAIEAAHVLLTVPFALTGGVYLLWFLGYNLDIVRARVDAGGTPPLERDLLDVEMRRFQAARLLAIGRADAAVVQVKQLLGIPPSDSLLLRETLETLVAAAAGRAATPVSSASIAERPDVREAAGRVALADARIDQARREGRADVGVYATYMRMDAGFAQEGFGTAGAIERVRGQFNYVAGGATVMLPLFNRNQGQVAAVEAEKTGAEARRDAADLAAHAEVAAAQARDTQARRAVEVYAGGARALARQNLDVVRQTFELGRATVFDVLTEQRRYLEIEQAYTTALREAWEARALLSRALGETR